MQQSNAVPMSKSYPRTSLSFMTCTMGATPLSAQNSNISCSCSKHSEQQQKQKQESCDSTYLVIFAMLYCYVCQLQLLLCGQEIFFTFSLIKYFSILVE
jgi:hypothetical protein